MHLVTPDGRVYAGGRAVGPLLARLPGGRLLTPWLRIPGMQRLVDRVYDAVARRRHRLGCDSAGCHWR